MISVGFCVGTQALNGTRGTASGQIIYTLSSLYDGLFTLFWSIIELTTSGNDKNVRVCIGTLRPWMPLATRTPQTPKDSEALESRQKMLYLLLFGLALSKDGNITCSEGLKWHLLWHVIWHLAHGDPWCTTENGPSVRERREAVKEREEEMEMWERKKGRLEKKKSRLGKRGEEKQIKREKKKSWLRKMKKRFEKRKKSRLVKRGRKVE